MQVHMNSIQGKKCFICHRDPVELDPVYTAYETLLRELDENSLVPIRKSIEELRSKIGTLVAIRGTKGLNIKLYKVSGNSVQANKSQVKELVDELAPNLRPLLEYGWDNYIPRDPNYPDNSYLKFNATLGTILEPIISEESQELAKLEARLEVQQKERPREISHPRLQQVVVNLPGHVRSGLSAEKSSNRTGSRDDSETLTVTVGLCPICATLLEQASRAAHAVIAERNAPPDDDDDDPSPSNGDDDNPAEDFQSEND